MSVADPHCVVVTIDGPAGSGKSTTAAAVARRLGFRYLDTGALYRAVTLALLEAGWTPQAGEPARVGISLRGLDISLAWADGAMTVLCGGQVVEDGALRAPGVTAAVSHVAALPAVRGLLLGLQRGFAQAPGLVCEGRDMGTVVFPEAQVKVFLTADSAERARRRIMQREGRCPGDAEVAAEAGRLERRDALDSSRAAAPLRRPPSSAAIDTTRRSQECVVERIVDLVGALEVGFPRGTSRG